ncbi:hypothetical protein ACFL0Y_02395 [Patescibacteria group bacterium]
MTNLTQAAYYTKRILTAAIMVLVGIIVLRSSLTITQAIWNKFRPEPPPEPTVAFGKLPKIEFPEQKIPDLNFKLETIEGALPLFEELGKVYFIPQKNISLLSLERAKDKALSLGFRNDPESINNISYRWTKNTEPKTILEMNINTGSFYLHHFYEESPIFLAGRKLISDDQAILIARNWFSAGDSFDKELNKGHGEVIRYQFAPPNLLPANSISETDFIRVNLFREDLDDLKILPPNPKESLISILISATQGTKEKVLEVKYNFYPIDRETQSTYPLKLVSQAWEELQNNQAYIAHLGKNQDGNVVIRKVTLAYYDSGTSINFLQPIYVFEGDRDFFAYVSAISDAWLQ